jgi:formate dehydrogenase maturation protein FdhE
MVGNKSRLILQALEEAEAQNPELSAYYQFHHALFKVLDQAKGEISGTLDMAGGEALQARLLQGLSALSFAQLPLEVEQFACLLSTVAQLLMEYDPELAGQTIPDSPAECLATARQRFEEGQAGKEHGGEHGDRTLTQVSVDLALKPYLERAAEQVLPHLNQELWKRGYCPVCGGAPDFAVLDEDAGARHLLCSRCDSVWLYQRLGCPFCGTTDHTQLFYYPSEDNVYRLYVCETCQRYLKAIDLRETGREVLLPVERVTTVAIDAAAWQKGYR